MTSTPKYLLDAAQDLDVLRSFHSKATPAPARMTGLEEEIFIYNANRDMALASHEDNVNLECALIDGYMSMEEADDISLEPGAHMIETKTDAFTQTLQSSLVSQMELRRGRILYHAADQGLVRSPYSSLPSTTPQEAMDNMIRRVADKPERGDRQITLMRVFQNAIKQAQHYPVCSVGEQYTHGCRDTNELMDVKRIMYALSPLVYNLFDNSPPYIGGERQTVHPVVDLRMRLGSNGFIDSTAFEASDGEDYATRKFIQVLEKSLFVRHDGKGDYLEIPNGETLTFKEAFERGEGTTLLYVMAQIQGWPFQKDKLFHSAKKGFYSIGNEIRDLGNGPAAPSLAVALFTPIIFEEEFRAVLKNILEEKYGLPIDSDPMAAFEAINQNMQATHKRMPADGFDPAVFLNAPFGKNGHTQLSFLREDLVPLLQAHHAGTALSPSMTPLIHIAETGLTDSQYFHNTQQTLQDTIDFMTPKKGYDQFVFQNTARTFAQMDQDGDIRNPRVCLVSTPLPLSKGPSV